ncbi:MAG: dihydroneopterin aldolase [Acutalibacteraceae bacterium]|nr:dihydroneopterin aldolase [Acutalibacteraceae bacterium]
MDKILIRNLKIFAYHGVHDYEKENGQNFVFDIDVFVDVSDACKSDNVDDTVSYSAVIYQVQKIFTENKYDLLEKAAQTVADGLFESFDKIQSLRILLKKPEAPIKADFDYVGVEIFREREEK